MENDKVKTWFHLNWPKEACDSLKTAIACVLEKKNSNSPEIQSLGSDTREVLLRFLRCDEPLRVSIEDDPDGGIVVKDDDGIFTPETTTDLLSAIMKDHNIPGDVSFFWYNESDIDPISGGKAVVSAEIIRVTYNSELYDLHKKANHVAKEIENIIFQNDDEPDERPFAPW